MRVTKYHVGLLCLLGAATGCSDSGPIILRDTLVTWNELADYLGQVTDEESAARVVDEKLKPLKAKWEDVKKRHGKFSKYDKDEKQLLAAGMLYYAPEANASLDQLVKHAARVKNIRSKLETGRAGKGGRVDPAKEWPKLTECISAASGYTVELQGVFDEKDRKSISLGGTPLDKMMNKVVEPWKTPTGLASKEKSGT